jgi:hypothetical protein
VIITHSSPHAQCQANAKKGLKLAGAYVGEETYKRLKAEAKRRGMALADLIRQLIQEYLNK